MTTGRALSQVLFILVLLAGLYLLAVRPVRARNRTLAEVQAGLRVGDRVVTTAALVGTVTALETDAVLLEIAPGVVVRFLPGAVVRVLEADR